VKYKTTNFHGLKISLQNEEEAEKIYEDIFPGKEYEFNLKSKEPFIIDCGAHIGMSVIYFKQKFPNSEIIAFEPNPGNFKLLNINIKQNNLGKIKTVQKAVSSKEGYQKYYVSNEKTSPWTWGDSLKKNDWTDLSSHIEVETVRLSSFINKKVDLLKIDIEGAETEVIAEIEHKLKLVKNIVLEFHGSSINPKNQHEEILKILQKNNFGISIKQEGKKITEDKINKTDPYWLIIKATRQLLPLPQSKPKIRIRINYPFSLL